MLLNVGLRSTKLAPCDSDFMQSSQLPSEDDKELVDPRRANLFSSEKNPLVDFDLRSTFFSAFFEGRLDVVWLWRMTLFAPVDPGGGARKLTRKKPLSVMEVSSEYDIRLEDVLSPEVILERHFDRTSLFNASWKTRMARPWRVFSKAKMYWKGSFASSIIGIARSQVIPRRKESPIAPFAFFIVIRKRPLDL